MQVMIYFANAISMILCAVILDCYFSIFATSRITKKRYVILFNLAYILFGIILNILIDNQIIYTLFMYLLTIIYSFAYNLHISKRAYITISIQVIMILSEVLFSLLISAISALSPDELGTNILAYMSAVALSKVAVFAIIKPISIRKTNKSSSKLPRPLLIGFIILPITSFAVMFYMTKTLYEAEKISTKIIGLSISALLVLSNIIIFFLFENILRVKDKEHEMTQKAIILEHEKQYYSDLYNKQSASDKIMHDLRHKFYAFKEVLDKNYGKAKEMVDALYSELNSVQKMKITGVVSVDSLLNTKIIQAKQNNININITSFLADDIEINDIDLCVILGNLLDNSLEACIEDKKTIDKTIKVQLTQHENKIVIKINNTYEDKGIIGKTSKKDKLHHGFGLQNVKELIDKYEGYYLVDKKDKLYCTTVIL